MVSKYNDSMSKLPLLFRRHTILVYALTLSFVAGSLLTLNHIQRESANTRIMSLAGEKTSVEKQAADSKKQLSDLQKKLQEIESQDQVQINKKNTEEIKQIQTTFSKASKLYEQLLEFKATNKTKTDDIDKLFALAIKQLSEKNYASADASMSEITKKLDAEKQKTATTFSIPANVPVNNTAPASGFSRQQVTTSYGNFLIDIVSADLNSTRVIVDTASESDCRDNCPVLSLGDYVSRNGAFAGINGSYFCPASYPSCAGKTNSFDTLLMNKNKKYFNSDNNVYSTVPVAVFGSGFARFIGRSLDWGRATDIDAVIANQPLLVSGGNVVFGGDGDPKKGSRGTRSFVANKGSTVYIGVVHNATVAEVAHALKALGIENALNLDSGGSTALWHGGYKAGPGRNIPNAILFVRR
jgi:exopolysaccharide biosynthesis protein